MDAVTCRMVSKRAGWPPCPPPAGEGACGVVEYPAGYGYRPGAPPVLFVSSRYGYINLVMRFIPAGNPNPEGGGTVELRDGGEIPSGLAGGNSDGLITCVIVMFENSNVVYDNPKPKSKRGVMLFLSKYR